MGVLYHKKIKYTGGSRDVNAMHWNDNAILGAKNLLPNNATSKTINGVTFTVNSDGSVTANGTGSSGDSLIGCNLGRLPIGKYILTGCPSDGGSTKYDMRLGTTSNPSSSWGEYVGLDSGEGLSFEVTNSSLYYTLSFRVYEGYTANNLTFYPMIRLATDTDDTYVPYAMTNRELTAALQSLNIDLQTSY